ncbi:MULTISPECIES: DUF6283 family protein [Mycolicibacter]|uniref:DUF6283 family protein n=2 Tax=Mycolicibacter TaxID=1073531 RepID=A0ABU5XMN5_9MYCO|nr:MULTISPECIES: DUF6283 family protein [unclassified Mycolicibacter]MEB3023022.1 DUF6283 family protein [Mycolicibacter sp. MYC098]MEB3033532.1 DUF6283 family protein [Mycolicibacter sp. MYC340]
MTGQFAGPAPNPCASCPYRRDVPSGIWHQDEYAKLPHYDEPTYDQPLNAFLCHQNGPDDPHGRLCAGWVGCHGGELLALRVAAADGRLNPDDAARAFYYRTPVPLFSSGAEAATHGMRDLEFPSEAALSTAAKIARRRPDIET